MAARDRMLVAHDLPMSLADAGMELGKLGEGWYFPPDPFAMIDELLAEGQISVEREGVGRIYAYLHPKAGDVVTGDGATPEEALRVIYRKLRDGS